jgi:putative FmdB family regulatory protein
MPLYEYICDKCHDEFELLVRGGEKVSCPSCGSEGLKQQLSIVAAHTGGRQAQAACEVPMPGGGCGLPQCGMGRCAME